jgi:hypothetical protein
MNSKESQGWLRVLWEPERKDCGKNRESQRAKVQKKKRMGFVIEVGSDCLWQLGLWA